MRALRKGQAAMFNHVRDIPGEARLVGRAFSLGACVLTEASSCSVSGSRPCECEHDIAQDHADTADSLQQSL